MAIALQLLEILDEDILCEYQQALGVTKATIRAALYGGASIFQQECAQQIGNLLDLNHLGAAHHLNDVESGLVHSFDILVEEK